MDFAVDAKEAFHKVKEKQYDAILMDINLKSGMDGVELTKEIRKLPGYNSIPVVAITAYAGEFDRREFLAHGMDYFIPKPFEFQEVLDVMKEVFKEKEGP
jgi:CheY-like chemotaxis protein